MMVGRVARWAAGVALLAPLAAGSGAWAAGMTARDLKATARIVRHRVKELGIDYKRYSGKRG